DGSEQIRQLGRAGGPDAAAVVMEATDGERGDGRADGQTGGQKTGDQEKYQSARPPDRPSAFLHSSFTNRYAVFLVIPVSAARRSATSLRVIPWARRARARSAGSGGRSARTALPVPATTTVTSPRAGASA